MKGKRIFQILLAGIGICFLLFSACSEMSLFTLLEKEQPGEFRVTPRSINLQTDDEYQITAQGGFLPYSYVIVQEPDNDKGSINMKTGLYKAPGPGSLEDTDFLKLEVEIRDGLNTLKKTDIWVYKPLRADPNSFTIEKNDTDNRSISIEGGVPDYKYGWEGDDEDPISYNEIVDRNFSFTPPEEPGTYYIVVKDSIKNLVFIQVRILTADSLRIDPEFKIIPPSDSSIDIVFEVLGLEDPSNPANLLYLSNPETGSVEWIPDESRIEFTTSPPLEEGTSFYITITDADGNTARTDILVQEDEELPPLVLSPSSASVQSGSSLTFKAFGGVKPYSFSAVPGKNTVTLISEDTVEVTVSGPPWSAELRADDQLGNRATANIEILR